MDILIAIGAGLAGFATGVIAVYYFQVVPLVDKLISMRKEGYISTYNAEPDRPEPTPWDDYIEG
jgi:hypothetical protein